MRLAVLRSDSNCTSTQLGPRRGRIFLRFVQYCVVDQASFADIGCDGDQDWAFIEFFQLLKIFCVYHANVIDTHARLALNSGADYFFKLRRVSLALLEKFLSPRQPTMNHCS